MGFKRRGIDEVEQIEVVSRAQWRQWLSKNWNQRDGVWLVSYKKHHQNYLPLADIVQEALCFGWIDGRRRRVDEDRTTIYVSPRKPGSMWSGINKKHVEELRAQNLLHPSVVAKIEAAKQDGSWTLLDEVEAKVIPEDLGIALARIAQAKTNFEAFTDGDIRGLLWWIKSAKTDATREKRVAATAEQAGRGLVANR